MDTLKSWQIKAIFQVSKLTWRVNIMNKKKIAGSIAAAAAIAFASAPITSTIAQAATSDVKCYGVNACKGESACKTASSSCKGHNSCKGKGFVMKTADECTTLGGSTEEPSA